MVNIILERFKKYIIEKNKEISKTLKNLENQIQGITVKLNNLSDVLADGLERKQRQMILEKMEKLEDEKIALKEYVLREKANIELDVPTKEELLCCLKRAQEMFRERTLEEMQQLIDLYVEKIIVHEDEIEVILNLVPLFYRHSFTRQVSKISRKDLKEKNR